jgi:P4 family phage/plasmid primase-like protien
MTTSALDSPKDYALYYHDSIELGFSVFVLQNPEDGGRTKEQLKARKKPAVLWDLYQIMRPSKIQIERWFAKNPNYNVAVATGNISNNIIAFDVDGPTAKKRVEEKRLGMSTNLRVALDNTMLNRTGSGGIHIIFRLDEPTGISQKVIWSDGQAHSQILMQGNGHYLVMPPSRHPNGNRYQWNGKAPHLITTKVLNEFILLLRPSILNHQQHKKEEKEAALMVQGPQSIIPQQKKLDPNQINPPARTLTFDKMQELLSWVKPFYTPGTRDHTIFYLSGMMRKNGGYPLDIARMFVKLLSNASGYPDEDLDKSLTVVDNTYRKPLDELNGKSGLYDLLVRSYETSNRDEYLVRAEAFSQICQIINDPPPSLLSSDTTLTSNSENTLSVKEEGKMLIIEKAEYDDNSKIITYLTMQVMQSLTLRTLFDSREILYYDKGQKFYLPSGDRIIDMEVERIIKEIGAPFAIRSYVKGEIQKCIADNTIVYREQFDADPHVINLENCLLDIMTLKQREQTPDYLTMSKLPITYDPIAECPRIEKFLGEVIQEPHKLKEVLKFWAYVLLKDCRYEKGLMLLGGGSNGKSVLIKLFEEAVGKDDCCNLSLHELEEDRFARARLFGKALNTYADNKSQRLKETGNLKTTISGDMVEGQEKFKPRFKFRPRAKLIISTNNPPQTDDRTHAFYRRWLIVMFERTFVPTDDKNVPNRIDPDLITKLTTQEELSGFLNLGLKYLPILIKENGFSAEPIDKVKKEYDQKADHVTRYLQEYCIIDSTKKDYSTKTTELYSHYVRICREIMQVRELDENIFGSKLVEHGVLHKRRRIKKGEGGRMEYVYDGIILKHKIYQDQCSVLATTDNARGGADIAMTTVSSGGPPSEITEREVVECPYCAIENTAGNAPLFRSKSLREVQLHLIFNHPGLDFEGIEG